MKNNCSKKLLSSVLLATSLSAVSVNNKIANAAFESYKRDERASLNAFVEEAKTCSDLQYIYLDLLKVLQTILENRSNGNVNSRLKNSMEEKQLSVKVLENEILRQHSLSTSFLNANNLQSVQNFINKYVIGLRGRYYTVWSTDVINAVNNLLKHINEELQVNDSSNIEKKTDNNNLSKSSNNSNNIEKIKKIVKVENNQVIPDCVWETLEKIYNIDFSDINVSTEEIDKRVEFLDVNDFETNFGLYNFSSNYNYLFEVLNLIFENKEKNCSLDVKNDLCILSFDGMDGNKVKKKMYSVVFPKESKDENLRFCVYENLLNITYFCEVNN